MKCPAITYSDSPNRYGCSKFPQIIFNMKRKQLRLKGYDYSQAGAYFLTICAVDKFNYFGMIKEGRMLLNCAGEMVHKIWNELPQEYSGISIDEFIVMPNHIHGIIMINAVEAGPCARLDKMPIWAGTGACHCGPAQGPARTNRLSLSDYIHRYKSLTTALYRKYFSNGPIVFHGKLWQRSFFDHIIRNESDLKCTREYIINNPLTWDLDENYESKRSRLTVK